MNMIWSLLFCSRPVRIARQHIGYKSSPVEPFDPSLLSGIGTASMRSFHVRQAQLSRRHGFGPSPTVLHTLADVYGTSPQKLLDLHDLAVLTEQQRHCLLTAGGRPSSAAEQSTVWLCILGDRGQSTR